MRVEEICEGRLESRAEKTGQKITQRHRVRGVSQRREEERRREKRVSKSGVTERWECMDKFLIRGGKALRGTVEISGAKNSALPAMAAALLTADAVTLRNIPKVRDIITMSKLLAFM